MSQQILCKVLSKLARRGTTGEVQLVRLTPITSQQSQKSATFTISMFGSVSVGDTVVISKQRIKYAGL